MATIADNLQAVSQRIAEAARAASREASEVALLAVSKTHPAERIAQAAAAGQRAFGENYVQEALDKMDALHAPSGIARADIEWHLIGPLQSNKTRAAAERFDWVQSVASEKVARRLAEQRPASLPPLNVLVQVNASGEASKSGVAPEEALALAGAIHALPRLRLRGLMAIPEPGAPRSRYRAMRELFDAFRSRYACDTLSLGMSDDLEMAIAEGSTMVRVGTAVFGARLRAPAGDEMHGKEKDTA